MTSLWIYAMKIPDQLQQLLLSFALWENIGLKYFQAWHEYNYDFTHFMSTVSSNVKFAYLRKYIIASAYTICCC